MKLTEIFMQLSHGELSQLNMGELVEGKIPQEHIGPLVSHINLGLTALHKRFLLKEGRFNLLLQPGRYTYALTSEYAENSLDAFGTDLYIEDSPEAPFQNDIHKIERVHVPNGRELGLNDEENEYSCSTPSYNILRVPVDIVEQSVDLPEWYKTNKLLVVYRANHPVIELGRGRVNPDNIEVDIPYSHLEALLYFIASRVNNPIGMANEFHAGNSWAAKYEHECSRLEQLNLRVDPNVTNTRLQRGGWV